MTYAFSFQALQFYWRSLLRSSDSAQETLRLGFQPYVPQCDGLGNWVPVQCYESSGEGWLEQTLE